MSIRIFLPPSLRLRAEYEVRIRGPIDKTNYEFRVHRRKGRPNERQGFDFARLEIES